MRSCRTCLPSLLTMMVLAGALISCRQNAPAALFEAAEKGDAGRIKGLLSGGTPVNSRTADGMTALMLACRSGSANAASALLSSGADVNAVDAEGLSALIAASEAANSASVDLLLRHGANPAAKDSSGNSALLWACMNGDISSARLLLTARAPVNDANRYGQTALIRAAANREELPELVELLIAAGADVKVRDSQHRSALDWAMLQGHKRVAAIIAKSISQRR